MSKYGVAFPFTTKLANELANESNSGVTGELLSLLVFVHGMGTRCRLDSGVSRWCTLSCKSVESF
jgi:hypothetical protein